MTRDIGYYYAVLYSIILVQTADNRPKVVLNMWRWGEGDVWFDS